MKKIIAIAATSLLASHVAVANPYVGVSYGFLETEIFNTDFDTPVVQLGLGNDFTENFAAEFRLGLGADEDSKFGADLEIDKYFALYLKPMLPITEGFSIYALLGYADVTVDSRVGDEDDSDFSYGFGATVAASPGVGIFAEYLNLYDDSNVEISGFSLGVNIYF